MVGEAEQSRKRRRRSTGTAPSSKQILCHDMNTDPPHLPNKEQFYSYFVTRLKTIADRLTSTQNTQQLFCNSMNTRLSCLETQVTLKTIHHDHNNKVETVVGNEVAGNGQELGTCMQSYDREENFEPVNEEYLVKTVLPPFEPLTPEKPCKAGKWQKSAISYLSRGEMHIGKDAQVNKIFSDEVKELLAENRNKQSQLCVTNSDKEGAEETDLWKTPNLQTRKKRYRPKVTVEGHPKKTSKPAAENPVFSSGTTKVKRMYVRTRRKGANNLNNTPLEGRKRETDSNKIPPKLSTENPAFSLVTTNVKRKYVRERGVDHLNNTSLEGVNSENDSNKSHPNSKDTPIEKRKYVREKGINKPEVTKLDEGSIDAANGKLVRLTRNSCRRSLNFDLESQEKDEGSSHCPSSNRDIESHEENFNAKDHLKETMQCRHRMSVVMEKTDMGVTNESTCFTNQVLKDYQLKPERHSPNPFPQTKMGPLPDDYTLTDQHVATRGKCQTVFSNVTQDKEEHAVQLKVNPDCQLTINIPNDSNCSNNKYLNTERNARTFKRHRVDTATRSLQSTMMASGNRENLEKCPFRDTTTTWKDRSNMCNSNGFINLTSSPLAKKFRYLSTIYAITEQHNRLDLNAKSNQVPARDQNHHHIYYQEQHALVPHQRGGAVIPFDNSLDQVKRRRPRPKVELDDETIQEWQLLLENVNSEGIDGNDEGKTKWWKEERRVFSERAYSFIARMHLVQGDRHFSPWKGSVLDSVIGVFLTQNVSDHLSSSAFMSLVAQFSLKSKTNSTELHEERVDTNAMEPEKYVMNLNESSGVNEEVLNKEAYGEDSEILHEIEGCSCHTENSENSKSMRGHLTTNYPDNHPSNKDHVPKKKGGQIGKVKEIPIDWDSLRKQAQTLGRKRERTRNTMDSVDWEAVRCADVNELARIIQKRGMHNRLAERIQDFLNRLVIEHGSLDLEWLRDIPPDKAKEYLLSVKGLGLKSVECVRLLTLHHPAFPVDTNVGRIAVRLGWVPLQPLPESLQLHLLELYPIMDSIQKYVWPRLWKLDQKILYELHYQMITFGKVFCSKSKPNCNACPMRGECRHFASAFASATLALPAPEEKSVSLATENRESNQNPAKKRNLLQLPSPQPNQIVAESVVRNSPPIIEEPTKPEPTVEAPATPEPSYNQVPECDIENSFYEDPDEIPTIQLNMEEFTHNLWKIRRQNAEILEGEASKAIVALTPEAALIPLPKLKNVSQLRTEHRVYELPDSHPLLEGMDKREADDPCPYLLAIWTPGETANSIEPPERKCSSQEPQKLCNDETCLSCNSVREVNSLSVRGTLLIPCRTAMKGSFPLNGTYFQVNEVFSDQESSLHPMDIPRKWLWNLPRRTVSFATSIPTLFRGRTAEDIQYCFQRGFVCVRGFDRKTGAPRPLIVRFHCPASKLAAKWKGKTGQLEEGEGLSSTTVAKDIYRPRS